WRRPVRVDVLLCHEAANVENERDARDARRPEGDHRRHMRPRMHYLQPMASHDRCRFADPCDDVEYGGRKRWSLVIAQAVPVDPARHEPLPKLLATTTGQATLLVGQQVYNMPTPGQAVEIRNDLRVDERIFE